MLKCARKEVCYMRKKFLAISISLLAGINCPVQASNEVTVESGTGINNAVIEAENQFDYVKYSKVVPLGNNLNRSFYAMAALVQDRGEFAQDGYLAAGNCGIYAPIHAKEFGSITPKTPASTTQTSRNLIARF